MPKCKYGFYTCFFIGEQDFCNTCDGGQNYQMKEKKNPVGAPPKKKSEKKVGFSVTCTAKNLKKVKPLVKAYIKEIDT